MSIATYAELKTAIANWLNRDDLTDRIDEFIDLAEASFNRDLRTRSMEKRATADTVAADRELATPSDFLQLRHMSYTHGGITYNMEYVTPDYLFTKYSETETGMPRIFALIGDEFRFAPIPNAAYTIEIDYYGKITALDDTNTFNWLLLNSPDLYLFRSLLYAEPYLMNDERLAVWRQFVSDAMQSLIKSDTQTPSQPLSMKVA